MLFSEKLSIPRHGLSSRDYAQEAVEAMRQIHNSFVIMRTKLKEGLRKKLITDKEYQDWLECFHRLQHDWLGREVTTGEDVLLLQYMAKNAMEEAKKFCIPRSEV